MPNALKILDTENGIECMKSIKVLFKCKSNSKLRGVKDYMEINVNIRKYKVLKYS